MNTGMTAYLSSKQVLATLSQKGLTEAEGANYVASTLRVLGNNPKLANCTPKSILDCLALCAELKISPESSHGYIYFLPYGGKCTPLLGARGMKALLLKSPAVTKLSIHLVKEGDEVEYWEDTKYGVHYRFKPALFPKEGSELLGAIAYLESANPQRQHFTRMTKAEIDVIKGMSKSQAIWEKHYEEMAKKTIMRRLYKEVPAIIDDASVDKAMVLEDNDCTITEASEVRTAVDDEGEALIQELKAVEV